LAIVTILLQLPLEGSNTTVEEQWFINVGMETIPPVGQPKNILGIVDLYAFSRQLSGPIAVMPCTDTISWYVAGEYAHVSGSVVKAMYTAFSMFGDWNATGQDDIERPTVGMEDLSWPYNITGWVPQQVKLSDQAFARGYAIGEWRNILAEPTPMPTPAPTYQPAFMTMTVDRIEHDQLMASPQIAGPFQALIRQRVAAQVNVSVENVLIDSITKESTFLTKVAISVYPRNGPRNISDGELSAELTKSLLTDITELPGISAISSGQVAVTGPTVSKWVAPWERPDAVADTATSGQATTASLSGASSLETPRVYGGDFPGPGDVDVVQPGAPSVMH
jgi:hypothetical protein